MEGSPRPRWPGNRPDAYPCMVRVPDQKHVILGRASPSMRHTPFTKSCHHETSSRPNGPRSGACAEGSLHWHDRLADWRKDPPGPARAPARDVDHEESCTGHKRCVASLRRASTSISHTPPYQKHVTLSECEGPYAKRCGWESICPGARQVAASNRTQRCSQTTERMRRAPQPRATRSDVARNRPGLASNRSPPRIGRSKNDARLWV
jgi:hypothetical protein